MFLDRLAGSSPSATMNKELKHRGPPDLPFDHSDVRIYIDTLFLEGSLRSVPHPGAGALANHWAALGVSIDPLADRQTTAGRVAGISQGSHTPSRRQASRLVDLCPALGRTFGSLASKPIVLSEETLGTIPALQATMDAKLLHLDPNVRFAGLHNQPAMPPVMIHQIPRAMAREMEKVDKSCGIAGDGWFGSRSMGGATRHSLQANPRPKTPRRWGFCLGAHDHLGFTPGCIRWKTAPLFS